MATVAELGQHVYNWLSRNGFPVHEYQVQPQQPSATSLGSVAPGSVFISQRIMPGLQSAAARLGARGALNGGQKRALNTLMHEALHQMRYARTPEFYGGDAGAGTPVGYEEGAVQSVTNDLMGAFLAQMYGDKIAGEQKRWPQDVGYYPDQVTNVRQLSTFGSGAKSYTDRAARVWRRSFLHADADTRQQMAEAATAKRVAWGKRTGR